MQRRIYIALAATGAVLLLVVLIAGTLPVSWLRDAAEQRISKIYGAPVTIGRLSRESWFSFSPEITVHDLRIGQPEWAGEGDFLAVERASARIPVTAIVTGSVTLHSLNISGLEVNLVRDAEGTSNWSSRRPGQNEPDGQPFMLEELVIEDSRFSLRDGKRRLDIAGQLSADSIDGLIIEASGRFDGRAATLTARGSPMTGDAAQAGWPFSLRMDSPALALEVEGTMAGALNVRDAQANIMARASDLKQIDYLIEAGLFGTQEVDVSGAVRRSGSDWFIDNLEGSIGRSHIKASGSVLKRDGRTKIDADIHSTGLDFDDLADDAGLASARALEARIGERVIPNTKIDLSKMGPTDGEIRFTVDRLLIEGGSAFRTLRGRLSLDHRVVRVDELHVGLESGRMTGWIQVDSSGDTPRLSTDLRVEGTSLQTLLGQPDIITGSLRGVIRIDGSGTTIREAFGRSSGKIAFVANSGSIRRTAAFILGQDLGGAIGQQLRDRDAMVPMNCAILQFDVSNGLMRPSPVMIDTEVSRGQGSGQITLDGERVDIRIGGVSKGGAALDLADPIRVGGTLSDPAISLTGDTPSQNERGGGILRAVGRSIGNALGLRDADNDNPPVSNRRVVNCGAMIRTALS